MPLIDHLNASGTQGVERMGLLTFYLQFAGHKDDAYIYKASCTPGFQSADILNANIRFAQVTGKVLQTIYTTKEQAEHTFIAEVQTILFELHQISQSVPKDSALNFSNRLEVTRNSATLHLMLYQAIFLATSPVLLRLARERVKGQHQSTSKSLDSFAKTCVDAACHTLNILCSFQRQNLIAFPAGFGFALAESIHPSPHSLSGFSGIRSCLDILRHLESQGNKLSAARQRDILHMRNELDIVQGQAANYSNMSIPDYDRSSGLVRSKQNPPPEAQTTEPDLDSSIALEQPIDSLEAMCPDDMISGEDSHNLYASTIMIT
ncbi:uncharacterized protein A1O9_02918 [Exophiala aquamarina CBS 119918]|uniref:Transcription factor domain-containing protein n=1 Tax=Exophiala aquamarina CBS 119918 TaxID=1182545 RepID=A0A072PNP6_9EURO|nr:uncharacterized protein A1O9_02918 [Exophiala aquamarina CBS 119918]KEF61352.1 hypothetical protein A1O9_02918 [Exophiala aquamarina CBS 119918]